jgi:hypothetical protein
MSLLYTYVFLFDSSTRRVLQDSFREDSWTNNRGGERLASGPLGNRIDLARLPLTRARGPCGPRRSPEGHDWLRLVGWLGWCARARFDRHDC